jgi:hypothetical protein
MTPDQLTELRTYIQNDSALNAMATAGQDNDIVEELYGRTETIIDPKAMIGSRGIVAILDVIDGEAFIKAMEDFTDAALDESNPLKPYQAGVKRQLAWLDRDAGLEIGNDRTRAMLDAFSSAGIVNAAHAELIKAAAEKTVSIPEGRGWGGVSHMDVAHAVRDSSGNLLIGN